MSIVGLLVAFAVTAVLVWLVQQGRVPAPFQWIIWAILLVVWIVVLLQVTGMGHNFNIGGA